MAWFILVWSRIVLCSGGSNVGSTEPTRIRERNWHLQDKENSVIREKRQSDKKVVKLAQRCSPREALMPWHARSRD